MEFDAKLRTLMKARRISQEMIAAECGVSQALVSNWARGKSVPDLRENAALARMLGVPIAYLADDAIEDPATAAGEPITTEEMHVLRYFRRMGLDWGSAITGMAEEVRRRDERGDVPRVLMQTPLDPETLRQIRKEIGKGDGPGGGDGGGGRPGRTGPQKEEKLDASMRRRRADHGRDAKE